MKCLCLNAWEQQAIWLAVSMEQPGTAPHSKVCAVFSQGVTRDTAEDPDMSSPSGRAANTGAAFSLCQQLSYSTLKPGLTFPEDKSWMCGAVQGAVLVEDECSRPRDLSLQNVCSQQLLQSCSTGNILLNRGTHLNALLAQLN